MSDALFLPRELFQPTAAHATSPRPATPAANAPRRVTAHFTSGADVAADLLQAMRPEPAFVERRRKPRSGKAFDITR